MKQKKLLLSLLSVLFFSLLDSSALAQNHLYKRIEIGTENMWSWIGATAISAFTNVYLHYPLVESSMVFSDINSDAHLKNFLREEEYDENGKEKDNMSGYQKSDARHLFNNIAVGGKIGYLSDRLGYLNYCAYGSAYYNLRQLRSSDYTNIYETHRFQLGGGAMLIFGSIESNSRFILDGGIRYNIPIGYNNTMESGKTEMLNSGITSHYTIRYSFKNIFSIGAFCNLMHYDLFNEKYITGPTNKVNEFGLTIQVLDGLFD